MTANVASVGRGFRPSRPASGHIGEKKLVVYNSTSFAPFDQLPGQCCATIAVVEESMHDGPGTPTRE